MAILNSKERGELYVHVDNFMERLLGDIQRWDEIEGSDFAATYFSGRLKARTFANLRELKTAIGDMLCDYVDAERRYLETLSISVGGIGNEYGGLHIQRLGDKYFWGIRNYDDTIKWEEISAELFNSLRSHEISRSQVAVYKAAMDDMERSG
jgi:hypothetical protein